MAEITVPNINDGDDASAADINSRFALVAATVNDLSSENLGIHSVTQDKIAPEAVTQDKINWDGQGVIFHQTFGGGQTIVQNPVPFAQLPAITVPLRTGYAYKIYIQLRQMNMLNPAPGTINLRVKQGTTTLGHGTVAFETSSHAYIDPTLEVSAYFLSTTTANTTLNVEMSYNRANTSPGVGHIISQTGGYALVECIGKSST